MQKTLERKNSEANPYSEMDLPQLLGAQRRIGAELGDVKKIAGQIEAAIADRVAQEIASSRSYHKKPDGTITVAIEGVQVKATLPRKIDWDTGVLDEVSLDIEEAGHNPMEWIEYKLTIPEKNYKKMPAALRKIVDKARTTKLGKEKIELEDGQ